jgi:hypothetical protein
MFIYVRSKYVQSYIYYSLSQLNGCCLFNVLIFIFYVAHSGAENGKRQFVWKKLVVAYLKTVLRTLYYCSK